MPSVPSVWRCVVVSVLLSGLLASLWERCLSAQTLEGDALYQTGLQLFQAADYYAAMTECKRLTVLFPRHPRVTEAQLLIGLALQEERAYDDAVAHFQALAQQRTADDAIRVALFKLGELRFLQRQYRQAASHFYDFLSVFPDGPLALSSRYMLGLSWVLEDRLPEALQVWETLPPEDALTAQVRRLQEELHLFPRGTEKSPRLAGILSGILPGAGHLYAGKPGQALTAFVLNGAFVAGATLAFREDLEAPGAIMLFFETGWYLGTIRSATAAARDHNRQQRQWMVERLRTMYALPPLTLAALQEPGLGLRLAF